jgi:hypothetical protein
VVNKEAPDFLAKVVATAIEERAVSHDVLDGLLDISVLELCDRSLDGERD